MQYLLVSSFILVCLLNIFVGTEMRRYCNEIIVVRAVVKLLSTYMVKICL